MVGKKRRWSRRLIGFTAVIVTLIAAGAVLTKYVWGPDLIRRQTNDALKDHWDGPLSIDRVEFNFFGDHRLLGVRLSSRDGNTNCQAQSVRVLMEHWPSPGFKVVGLAVDKLSIDARRTAEGYSLPFRSPPPSPNPRADMRTIQFNDVSLGMFEHATLKELAGNFNVALDLTGKATGVKVTDLKAEEMEPMTVSGKVSRTPDGGISLRDFSVVTAEASIVRHFGGNLRIARASERRRNGPTGRRVA